MPGLDDSLMRSLFRGMAGENPADIIQALRVLHEINFEPLIVPPLESCDVRPSGNPHRRIRIYDGNPPGSHRSAINYSFGEIIPSILDTTVTMYDRMVEESQVDNGESSYGDDIPGMTLDEFQAWTDQLINEVKGQNAS